MISHFTRNSDRSVHHPLRNAVSCHDCFGAFHGINYFLVPMSGKKNGQSTVDVNMALVCFRNDEFET